MSISATFLPDRRGPLRVPRMGDTLYCHFLQLDPHSTHTLHPTFLPGEVTSFLLRDQKGMRSPLRESSWVGSPALQLLSRSQRLEDSRLGWGTECRAPSYFSLEQQVPLQPCSSSCSNASLKDPGLFSQQTEVPSARYPNRETSACSLSTFPTALEASCQDPKVVVSGHRPWQCPWDGFKFLYGTRHLKCNLDMAEQGANFLEWPLAKTGTVLWQLSHQGAPDSDQPSLAPTGLGDDISFFL